jgi:hypothetical protein
MVVKGRGRPKDGRVLRLSLGGQCAHKSTCMAEHGRNRLVCMPCAVQALLGCDVSCMAKGRRAFLWLAVLAGGHLFRAPTDSLREVSAGSSLFIFVSCQGCKRFHMFVRGVAQRSAWVRLQYLKFYRNYIHLYNINMRIVHAQWYCTISVKCIM